MQERPCIRCFQVKAPSQFPPHGRIGASRCKGGVPGVTRVCWGCIESQAHALNDTGYRPRVIKDWEENGALVRRCTTCRDVKQVEDFGAGRRTCRKCSNKRVNDRKKRDNEDRKRQERKRHADKARKRRAESPETRAKESEARKRYRAKVLASADAHAKMLENERISRRLRRELRGEPVTKFQPGRFFRLGARYLPAAPLAEFFDAKVEARRSTERALDYDDCDITSAAEVCRELEVEPRSLYAWRAGERKEVQVGVAERILMNANAEPEDVWPRGQFPALYAEGGPFYDEESIAA